MRLLAVLAVGLLLVPLAAGQSGSGNGRPGPSDGPGSDPQARQCMEEAENETAKRDCAAAYCEAHPGSAWCSASCPRPEDRCAPADGQRPEPKPPSRCEPPREGCPPACEPQRPEASKGNRSATPSPPAGDRPPCKREPVEGFKWIRFEIGADRATLLNYTVHGLLALESLRLEGVGTLQADRRGSLVRATDGQTSLVLHDGPNGLVHFEAGNATGATATLTFPAGARIERGEGGARVRYGNGERGLLRADNLTWLSDRSAVAPGFFSFHAPPAREPGDEDKEGRDARDERVQAAIERSHVGAEVVVRPRSNQTPVEVLSFDDVEARAQLPPGLATPDSPLRIVLSSNLTSGRTIVLRVDPLLLASPDPQRVVARYFDLHGEAQTEVLFRRASGLEDVLDPTDDGGQPEWHVVSDGSGVQVLVSVPRWSDHLVTLGSLGELVKPSVLLGVAAGIAATAVAAVALFRPRRRED